MSDTLVPKALLDGVIRRLDPVEVYLFGSRARGDAREDSDYDLYVVVDDEGADNKRTGRAIAEARHGWRGAVDMIVGGQTRFEHRRKLIGAIEEIISFEGRRIYVRGQ